MKDPLTPNLPEGWTHWAESSQTRLFGLGVLVALNLYLSVRIGRSAGYNRKEKQFWFLMLWLFPIIGACMYLQLSYQQAKLQRDQNAANKQLGTPPEESGA